MYRHKNISKALLSSAKIAARFCLPLLIMTVSAGSSVNLAHADAPVTDPVQTYCRKVVSGKAQAGCDNTDNIQHARYVATHHCGDVKSASSSKKIACVEKNAEHYIDVAASKKPGSADAFKTALDNELHHVGGDAHTAAQGFGSLTDNTTANTGKACDPSNGLCAPCSSNNPPSDCVKCTSKDCANSDAQCTADSCDLVLKYVNPAIDIATVSFGLVAAASLIFGAITYAASEGDPQKTARAKDRIAKTIFAVIAYMFLYSFLQFLIPGGAFNRL